MTLQITLPSHLEARLRQEAERRGQGQETVALCLLEEHLPPAIEVRRAAAVSLLRAWAEEDKSLSADELAANAELLRALDEDRPSDRKLFPELLDADLDSLSEDKRRLAFFE